MTPKEKAKELVDKFNNAEGCEWDFYETQEGNESCWRMSNSLAKQCALIAVDEILNELHQIQEYDYLLAQKITGKILFYNEVKTEIEKL